MIPDSNVSDIQWFLLENEQGMQVRLTNFGAILTEIHVPDRHGQLADVALGHATIGPYLNPSNHAYLGAVVGRYGNRIAQGRFELDGQFWQLETNNGPHHLHGGLRGWNRVVWEVKRNIAGSEVQLAYHSPDGEGGYPGTVEILVTYRLTDSNELIVSYQATSDRPTPINPTQHTYFNLHGEGERDVLDHDLQILASRYVPIDETAIPLGGLVDVAGTAFDFREPARIGYRIGRDDLQLQHGRGFDHCWAFDEPGQLSTVRAILTEPHSGRQLGIRTTEPGMQFYSGNYLDGGLIGKAGRPYHSRGGLCLETQHFPDSPNQPDFPGTILRPGELFRSDTIFAFSIC